METNSSAATGNSTSSNVKTQFMPPSAPDTKSPTREMDPSCSDSEGSDTETSNSAATTVAHSAPSGLILKSGRVRLPDKLMEYLNKEVAPEALYWMPEGESFAFDTEKAPEQILARFFGGTKLSSFLRSISRWGFKRVFFHNLEKHVYAFHHPLFRKDAPHLEKEMKMVGSAPSQSKKARKTKKLAKKQEAKQSPSTEAAPPAAGIASPVQLPQGPASLLSASATAGLIASPAPSYSLLPQPTTSSPGQLSTMTLPALASQARAPTAAAAANVDSSTVLNAGFLSGNAGLLQLLQPASAQPALQVGLGSLLQRPQGDGTANQLAQLLGLQGTTVLPGATGAVMQPGTTAVGLQEELLRLAVARQQVQQLQQQARQQQQQQAVLDLLNEVQRRRSNSPQG